MHSNMKVKLTRALNQEPQVPPGLGQQSQLNHQQDTHMNRLNT